jgi:preprotein translocase subunit SecA
MSKKKTTPTRASKAAQAKPARAEEATQPANTPEAAAASSAAPTRLPFRRPQSLNFAGVGRNDICPCGSGKRFKNCHGN